MEDYYLFGNRLKEERKKLGLNQAEIAKKCGVSREMWGKWERGENKPSSEKLFSFEQIGIDVQYVMHGRRGETVALPPDSLSPEEKELLALFRETAAADREMILMVARRAEKKAAFSAEKPRVKNNTHIGKVGQIVQADNIETVKGGNFKF